MKRNLSPLRPYLPWLLLLLGWDAFLILLLWLAEVQALRSLAAVILLATLFLFFSLCAVLIRQSRKREQAFREFLGQPDSRREEGSSCAACCIPKGFPSSWRRISRYCSLASWKRFSWKQYLPQIITPER